MSSSWSRICVGPGISDGSFAEPLDPGVLAGRIERAQDLLRSAA